MVEEPRLGPLIEVVRACQTGRAALGAAAAAREVGEFWRAQDALHGKRADYLMWRQLRWEDRFASRPGVAEALALRGLEAASPQVRWAVLAMVPALPRAACGGALAQAVERALSGGELKPAPQTGELLRWLVQSWLAAEDAVGGDRLEVLAAWLQKVEPNWKLGRAVTLERLEAEQWLPVELAVVKRWLGRAIVRWARADGAAWGWQITAWQLRRGLREEGGRPRAAEVEMLLDAGCMARVAGEKAEALRWTALALAMAPVRLPNRLQQRCGVAAWRLAEQAVLRPGLEEVKVESVPFSGDAPESEAGRAAAERFADEWDRSRDLLLKEVASDADWQVLREAGVALNHPLAALAWVGKKAVAHAVKKQHALLEAATRLALGHDCLMSAGKMLAVWPKDAAMVLAYAEALRLSWRHLPVLREEEGWRGLAASLRLAWGKLESMGMAIEDEERLFLLHETLVDRGETTRRCLPVALQGLAVAGADFSKLVEALDEEPRAMAALEHQRTLELWEIAALLRERVELSTSLWVSVVAVGEPAAGRYRVMMQGGVGRAIWSGRTSAEGGLGGADGVAELRAAAERCGREVNRVVLAVDETLAVVDWQVALARLAAGGEAVVGARVVRVPSWESAFRALREWQGQQPFPLA